MPTDFNILLYVIQVTGMYNLTLWRHLFTKLIFFLTYCWKWLGHPKIKFLSKSAKKWGKSRGWVPPPSPIRKRTGGGALLDSPFRYLSTDFDEIDTIWKVSKFYVDMSKKKFNLVKKWRHSDKLEISVTGMTFI